MIRLFTILLLLDYIVIITIITIFFNQKGHFNNRTPSLSLIWSCCWVCYRMHSSCYRSTMSELETLTAAWWFLWSQNRGTSWTWWSAETRPPPPPLPQNWTSFPVKILWAGLTRPSPSHRGRPNRTPGWQRRRAKTPTRHYSRTSSQPSPAQAQVLLMVLSELLPTYTTPSAGVSWSSSGV